MSRTFDQALAFVLDAEGGPAITDDPDDKGGLTRWGISQAAHPGVDIANLTRAGAEAIYRASYWDLCRCDEFPPPVALALFDSAVNQGPGTAIRLLQRALKVEADGVIGEDTLSAARRIVPDEVVIQFLARRTVRYALGQPKYVFGWVVRMFRLQRAILGLA